MQVRWGDVTTCEGRRSCAQYLGTWRKRRTKVPLAPSSCSETADSAEEGAQSTLLNEDPISQEGELVEPLPSNLDILCMAIDAVKETRQDKEHYEHQQGYQYDFRHIGYLMPVYLSPLLFYGTHGSRSLYCVVLAMSWWILGPLPKVANAFLLLLCPALLQVADPERLAASFFSADVLEATLLLLLSAADREVRSRLAPWLAIRSQAEGMRLRYLFPAVCLATFALATRISAALVTVVLFAIVDHALRSLEEANLDNCAFGEPVPLVVDDEQLLPHEASSPRSPPCPPTPRHMADHPLNWYSPPRMLGGPTTAKAARPTTSSGFSGDKKPLGMTPGPQASREKARVSLTVPDLESREPSYATSEELLKDGTLAPQVRSKMSGASSLPLAEPRPSETSLASEASNRSRHDHPFAVIGRTRDSYGGSELPVGHAISGTDPAAHAVDSSVKSTASRVLLFSSHKPTHPVHRGSGGSSSTTTGAATDASGRASGRVISLQRVLLRSGHDDAGSHKMTASFGHAYGMDDQTLEVEQRHRKYGEIRTAFLVGPVIMAVVGNVIGFRTLPSRIEMPLEEVGHTHTEREAPELDLWLWALLTFPGVIGVVLFCCGYFYVANLQRQKGKYLFLIYLATYSVILAYVEVLNLHATPVWTLATLVVVASSVSQQFGDRHAFERHHLFESMPWGVICVLGGAQLITHLTVEGRLVERLFELVSRSFWRNNSRVTNQLLLTGLSSVLAEAVGVAPLCRLLMPIIVTIASESSTRLLYYLVPVSVALSSNMLSPVSLPLALLHGACNISMQQLAFVGLAGKSILLAMVLLSVNTTGSYFFRWNDPSIPSHPINLSVAVLNPGPIAIHDAFSAPDKCTPSTWVEKFSKENEPFTLIIDSLSTALIYHPLDDVYMGLLCLLRKIASLQMIVALLHTDVHEEHEVGKLCHLATTTLTPYAHDSASTLGCKILHKKPSGRVVRDDEEFVLKPDLSITDIKKVAQKQDVKPLAQQPDPTANLTFNLRLSEEEKAAKDNLVLPYLK
ncbi:hypothetical protein HPB49_019512 [Dermacentor silvarum]|uniref:Uncharacterized protein n=1 Tax=Dermacentor silvarum TaxID=543639 RepID=A0ACB8D776_DERSI|nr:hypothetical protein HPB49_019512 [Dermacentor silvarum]